MWIDIINVTLVRKDNTVGIINKNSERSKLKKVNDDNIKNHHLAKDNNMKMTS